MESLTRKSLRHKVLLPLYVALTAITINSCKQREIYYHFHEIGDAKWAQNDTLVFDVDSLAYEPGVPYTMSLEVTNNVNYPYQNIWFFVQANIGADSVYDKQEKEFMLADEFGKWKGSGFASLYQSSLVLDDNVVFRERRVYRIKVEHGMRDEQLNGIEKVGVRIAKKE